LSKRVIITGDDFGLAIPVNEAIELAHREGVLTTTSLLVGEAAAADAAARAHRNPGLHVGLHVAVCDGRPTLPPNEIAALVNARGELRHPLVALLQLLLLGWLPARRRQLEAEIRAQFEAFRRLGLTPDHVNGHNNMQLHPVVLPTLMKVAREYGVTAIRLPYEPLLASWRAARHSFFSRLCVWLVMRPWASYVKGRLLRAGFVVNDYLFGVFDCGAMDSALMEGIIRNLPEGVSEIHCHPATRRCAEIDRAMPGYGHEQEFRALIDPGVRAALAAAGVQSIPGFSGARKSTAT
jgi:hopanoid biosynthesis associated protein HpnK